MGACASTSGGEIFGSALAHAKTNVLARLPFRGRRDLVLTTTLQPCLQCAGAIRLGPVATVRFAGPDRYWDGCHDFGKLSAREANRTQPARIGPRRDELGTFATLISRFVHLPPGYQEALRALGEGPVVDLVRELEGGGEVERLAAMDVIEGLGHLWPRLQAPRSRGLPGKGAAAARPSGHRTQDLLRLLVSSGASEEDEASSVGPCPRRTVPVGAAAAVGRLRPESHQASLIAATLAALHALNDNDTGGREAAASCGS